MRVLEPKLRESAVAAPRRLSTTLAVFALLLCQALASEPGAAKKRKQVRGNIESRFDQCDEFQGVFRAEGRFRPDLGFGDPIPDRIPDVGNYAFLSQTLGCYPKCSLGMHSTFTSFVVRYKNGALEWAAVHSPSGGVVYHGRHEVPCQDGVLVHSESFRLRIKEYVKEGVPLWPLPRGIGEDFRYLVINTDGSLVSYDAHRFRGTIFLIVPVGGKKLGKEWREFPPDPAIDRDLDALFDGLTAPNDTEVVKVGDPKDNPAVVEWESRQPESVTVANHGSEGLPLSVVGEVALRLSEVGIERGRDGYSTSYAKLSARLGREWLSFRLERSHRPGVEPEYQRVFDLELALRGVRVARARVSSLNPHWAFVSVKKEP